MVKLRSIKWKILIPAQLGLVIFVIAMTSFWASALSSRVMASFESNVKLSGEVVVPPLIDAVWNFDEELANTTLSVLKGFPGFKFVVVKSSGTPFASLNAREEWDPSWDEANSTYIDTDATDRIEFGELILSSVPLVADGDEIGRVFLGFDRAKIVADLAAVQQMAAGIGLVAFVAFACMLHFVTLRITRPVNQIVSSLGALENGATDIEVPEADRGDELGVLAQAVLRFRDAQVARGKLTEDQQDEQARQARVVATLGMSLERLSSGDLSTSIDETFPEAYEELRENFNSAVHALRSAVLAVAHQSKSIEGCSSEIQSATEDLAMRTEGQAKTLEHVSGAVNQFSEAFSVVAAWASEADAHSTAAEGRAQDCGSVAKRAIEAMDQIRESSDRVSRVTAMIEDISFQTNLLALNAGVEAARAGEAGRGFAVVASEVRTLSQRSSEAAKEIKGLIAESEGMVKQGADLVGQTGASLEQIIEAVTQITQKVAEIATASDSQISSVSEIKASIGELESATHQNAAMFEETSAAGKVLENTSHDLVASVAIFQTEANASASQTNDELWLAESSTSTEAVSVGQRAA